MSAGRHRARRFVVIAALTLGVTAGSAEAATPLRTADAIAMAFEEHGLTIGGKHQEVMSVRCFGQGAHGASKVNRYGVREFTYRRFTCTIILSGQTIFVHVRTATGGGFMWQRYA